SAVLLGNPEQLAGQRVPVTLHVAGSGGVIGSRVRVLDQQGKPVAVQEISGGDGRGGQRGPHARFRLAPGTYRGPAHYTSGLTRSGQVVVAAGSPVRGTIDDKTQSE